MVNKSLHFQNIAKNKNVVFFLVTHDNFDCHITIIFSNYCEKGEYCKNLVVYLNLKISIALD